MPAVTGLKHSFGRTTFPALGFGAATASSTRPTGYCVGDFLASLIAGLDDGLSCNSLG
jgi:hypothetical protein